MFLWWVMRRQIGFVGGLDLKTFLIYVVVNGFSSN